MIDFSDSLNLPLIWAGIIALAVFVYVFLDGFDLGCGILFPFAPSDQSRSRIMNSIAPFWDGNETWLVLGGGGLFAAFPVAYGIIMSGLYLPVIFMLFGLIFRGVAFEFRFKASEKQRPLWDRAFNIGSTVAAFFQGVILGALLQGLAVDDRVYAGGPLDWLSPFSFLCGFALVSGYALLGATWLMMKTSGETHHWSSGLLPKLVPLVFVMMALVSLGLMVIDATIRDFWLGQYPLIYLLPAVALVAFYRLWIHRERVHSYRPFALTVVIFLCGFGGVVFNIYPWMVPYELTFEEAAAANTSLSIMLIGVAIMLPIIAAYTVFSYYVFRGDQGHESLY